MKELLVSRPAATMAPGRSAYPSGSPGPIVGGAIASLAVAACLYTRFGINGSLSRDEAIYAYAGQQLSHGVPPYASIFDPKTPLASMIAGAAATVAHLTGHYDVYAIRAVFLACACLTALAVYLVAIDLWRSVLAGWVAAVVFTSFIGFAQDAFSGPDAKTPGIMFAVFSIWLIQRRRWLWAGAAAALATLVWQPLAAYVLVAAFAAVVLSARGERLAALARAVAGALAPVLAVLAYFAATGALADFIQAAFVFPLIGVTRPQETVGARVLHIAQVINSDYGFSGRLLWAGVSALLLLTVVHLIRGRANLRETWRDPLVIAVLTSLVLDVAYATMDFQSYPDIYPFLPYGALGLGGLTVAVVRAVRVPSARRATVAATLAATIALTAFSWTSFSGNSDIGRLQVQRAAACGLDRTVGSGRIWAIGSPVSLVLTHRRNPDRFIYLGSGVDAWKIHHTPGGFNGWVAQILAARPMAVVAGGWWGSSLTGEMIARLRAAGYRQRYIGARRVLLSPAARARARTYGVKLTIDSRNLATGLSGRELPACG